MNQGYINYKYYTSLKLHYFSKSFDAWKYNFKINTSKQAFENRKDKFLFNKVAMNNDSQTINYFTSYFYTNGKIHISKMIEDEYDQTYKQFMYNIGHLSDDYKKQLSTLNKNVVYETELNKPKLFMLLITKDVSINTICLLNLALNNKLFLYWEKHYNDTYFNKIFMFMQKYQSYLTKHIKVDINIYKELTKNIFKN